MQNNKMFNSAVSLVALLGIIVFGQVVLSRLSIKADITEEKLYTLSEGSVNIVEGLKAPLEIKLFFSDSIDGVPPLLKSYHQRVKAMLLELQSKSDQINLEFVDPEPDSDEELLAQRFGIQGQPVSSDGSFYFGVVMSNYNGEEVISYLDMQKADSLEYDLVRHIYLLTLDDLPKIGVISSLEVLGDEPKPNQFGMPQPPENEGWLFTRELKQSYELQKVDASEGSIPSDIDLLLVIQPKDLEDKAQYAIDQYVLSGKNAIFYVDPFLMREQQNRQQFQPPTPNLSLQKIFEKWGVTYNSSKVVLDPLYAYVQRTQGGGTKVPAVMNLRNESMSADDMSTSKLSNLFVLYPGQVGKDDGVESVEFTPLISTSAQGQTEDKMKLMYSTPEQLLSGLKENGETIHLAGLYSGLFRSAYDKAPEGVTGAHLSESTGKSHLAVVADVDMLEDQYWAQTFNFLGQTMIQARNQNTVLLNNLVEKLSGNDDLISLRSRSRFVRPFEKVLEKEEEARRQYQAKEQALQEKLQEVESKIAGLMQQADPGQKVVLSSDVQEKIENFRKEKLRVAKELRYVRKDLRSSIDELGTTLKGLNILLMPCFIALFGIVVAIRKSRRIAS